jgi:hypothetical protein
VLWERLVVGLRKVGPAQLPQKLSRWWHRL